MVRWSVLFPCFLAFPILGSAQFVWKELLESTENQWLLNEFIQSSSIPESPCPPDLAQHIFSSDLDNVLHPFISDKQKEAEAIESLFRQDCKGLESLRLLSDLYFPLFIKQLESNNLDLDYRFLPIVISALNPEFDTQVRCGLWGIDILTARSNGLRVDRFIDERKSADLSTQLAVKELKKFEKEFDGDRLKVIVAMLRGERYAKSFSIAKADVRLRDQLNVLHVVIRMFNHTESKPALMQWLKMLQNYEAIPIREPLSYSAIEAVLSISSQELHHLNPAFHGDTIPSNYRSVSFLIPADKKDQYFSLEDSIIAYVPKSAPVEQEIALIEESIYHTVKPGDVLGLIANRYGTSVSKIKQWNNLRSDRIQIGQKLKVGTSRQSVPIDSPKAKDSESTTYTVRNGDSLWKIANKYKGVTIEDIQRANSIGEDIRPGQKLIIPIGQ